MRRVLVVFGTRPEAIKMAPVVRELESRRDVVTPYVCVTAQHRGLLDQVLSVFDVRVDQDLDLMREKQALSDIMVRGLPLLEETIRRESPDVVLVHGDTTTAFVGALAAFYQGVKVGHVEAGLRTYNIRQPWPEEANRRFVDAISDYMFAPTEHARSNLLREGAAPSDVFVTGNTVVDALLQITTRQTDQVVGGIVEGLRRAGAPEAISTERIVLVTGHRRENFGPKLESMCEGLREIARRVPDSLIVYPVHPNPNVRDPVSRILSNESNVWLAPPLDYPTFVWLMRRAAIVITDSGGIQEEAPTFGVPILVTREATERPEGIEAGVARLVGSDATSISEAAVAILMDKNERAKFAQARNPYGDGQAAKRIVDCLLT